MAPHALDKLKQLPPALFARDTLREVKTALRAAAPFGREGVSVLATAAYDEHAPVEQYTLPNAAHLSDVTAFSAWLTGPTAPPQGVDSFYLSPRAWCSSPLSKVIHELSGDCGLKISKSLGDINSPYMTPRPGRRLQRRLSGSHSAQIETFRYLHARGIGPELFRVLELVDGSGAIRVCYVVEHIEGVTATADEFLTLVSTLQGLCAHGEATLVSGSGCQGRDFQLPDGNGNVITSLRDGAAKYIDVHSFRISALDQTQKMRRPGHTVRG